MELGRGLDPPDLQLHRRFHRWLRLAAGRLVADLQGLGDGDTAGAAALIRRLDAFGRAWRAHGRAEEDVLFVELVRRVPVFAGPAHFAVSDHGEARRLIADARSALAVLAPGGPARARAAAVALERHVREHLEGEELDMFPLIERNVDGDDWNGVERRAFRNIASTMMVGSTMLIEIWSDIACPWCFVGKRRFDAALAEFPHRESVEVRWRSYQLDPTLPEHYDGTELDYLVSRKGLTPEQVRPMFAHVAEQAAGEGLRYDFDRLVVANSHRAHQLIHAARDAGGDELAAAVKERLLSDHFEHGRDIGDLDHLVRIGIDVGMDANELRAALETSRYANAVRADIAEAQQLGLRGVPFLVIERTYGVSGAQSIEAFREALDQAWRELHPLYVLEGAGEGSVCGPDGCVS